MVRSLLIKNVTLIDGRGGEPLGGAGVLVSNGRIDKVGKTGELEAAEGARIIEANGMTLMPGLIEPHTHLGFIDWPTRMSGLSLDVAFPAQVVAIAAAQNAQHFLRSGYTSLIEAGEPYHVGIWVKRFVEAGRLRGPRILPSSRIIGTTGVGADALPPWWNLQSDMRGLTVLADGADECLKVTRNELHMGAELIKVIASGEGRYVGDYHPFFIHRPATQTTISYEELKAIVDETHRWGRIVMAHSRALQSTKLCLNVGVDIINHATRLDEESIRLFKERPPLGVSPALYSIKIVNKHWREEFGSREYYQATMYEEELELGLESATKLHKMGIRVVPGGDYGNQPVAEWQHGMGYAHELQLYVEEAGWTPMDVLVAATRDASYLMKMEREIGTIEEGKQGDMMLVDGDPLDDISVLQDARRISMVIKGGEVQAQHGRLLTLDAL